MAWLTSWRRTPRIGNALDGNTWVRKTTEMSSTGSTQKLVLAAPPHE